MTLPMSSPHCKRGRMTRWVICDNPMIRFMARRAPRDKRGAQEQWRATMARGRGEIRTSADPPSERDKHASDFDLCKCRHRDGGDARAGDRRLCQDNKLSLPDVAVTALAGPFEPPYMRDPGKAYARNPYFGRYRVEENKFSEVPCTQTRIAFSPGGN